MNIYDIRDFEIIIIDNSSLFVQWVEREFYLYLLHIDHTTFTVENKLIQPTDKGEYPSIFFTGLEFRSKRDKSEEELKFFRLGYVEIRDLGYGRLQVIGKSLHPAFSEVISKLHREILKVWKTDESNVEVSNIGGQLPSSNVQADPITSIEEDLLSTNTIQSDNDKDISVSKFPSPEKRISGSGKKKPSKKGPKTPPDEVKLQAVKEWDNIDFHTQTLEEWLGNRFGANFGVPNVKPSTFHGWRRKFIKEGKYTK